MIILDYRDHRPIYEQIVERFKELILNGGIEPDSQLPSVRSLAMELSINPNTIQRAYAQLERKGYIYSVKGKGSFIAGGGQLMKEKRTEIFDAVAKLVREAGNVGITQEEFVDQVRQSYGDVKE